MDIKFIGQGYNREVASSVASVLIEALNDNEYNSFKCLVAFATNAGISGLKQQILNSKSHISSFRIIVGINQFGTSKEGLEALLEWNVDSFVYYANQSLIFHPKIYLFEGENKVSVIIGSNNLTQKGLGQNIEGSIQITYNKSEENIGLIEQITEYFNPILTGENDCLKRLNTSLIDDLISRNKIKTESALRSQYSSGGGQSNDGDENGEDSPTMTDLFGSIPLQPMPLGFNPTRLTRGTTTSMNVESTVEEEIEELSTDLPTIFGSRIDLPTEWDYNSSSAVLIAEFGKGTRWKQVNFPMAIFTEFFGANIGDNTYHINLRHIENDSSIGEIENRQAVSVLSKNYRFEIGAASFLTQVQNIV